MKKSNIFHVAALVVILFLTAACDTSYFDNEIEDFKYDASVVGALGHAKYSLSELFEEVNVDSLSVDENGGLFITSTKKIEGLDGSTVEVTIPNNNFESKSINTPITAAILTPFGKTFPYTVAATELGNPNPLLGTTVINDPTNTNFVKELEDVNKKLTEAYLNGGNLIIQLGSTFDDDIEINLTLGIPSLKSKSTNDSFSESILLKGNTITLDGEIISEINIDLNEYNADFTHDGTDYDQTTNSFVINWDASITLEVGDLLNENDVITYSADLNNTSAEVIFGDFEQESFGVNTEENSFSIDFFSEIESGDVTIQNPTLTIDYTNGYGFPIGLDISNLTANRYKGEGDSRTLEESVALSYTASPMDTLLLDGIATYSNNTTPVSGSIVLNKDNSNINNFLSIEPTEFDLSVVAMANPEGKFTVNENFYETNNEGLDINVSIHVPLDIKFSDVTFEQESDFKNEDIAEIAKRLGIGLTVANRMPLEGSLVIEFLNDNNTLVTSDPIQFNSANIDATTKRATGEPVNTGSSLDFTTAELESIENATKIKIIFTFQTPENEAFVSLNTEDTIEAFIKVNGDVELGSDDDEENNDNE